MNLIGHQDVNVNDRCEMCGHPLGERDNDGKFRDVAGIVCGECGLMHVFHVDCASPETQVDLAIARLFEEASD